MAMEMGGGVPPSPPLETETHSHQEKEEKASWKVLGGSKSVATIVVPFFLQREFTPSLLDAKTGTARLTALMQASPGPKTTLIRGSRTAATAKPCSLDFLPPFSFLSKSSKKGAWSPHLSTCLGRSRCIG